MERREKQEEEGGGVMEFEIALAEEEEEIDLEKTVCSHGFFMMSPNHWDPLSRTFSRPLHLDYFEPSHSTSLSVSISHNSRSLLVRVYGTCSLAPRHKDSLEAQIVRMFRLSPTDNLNARQFRMTAAEIGDEACVWANEFGGRLFRSPTLFEDMVKCILLCNCQWSRTLSMANALCELQLELHSQSTQPNHILHQFFPNTPPIKEYKRKRKTNISVSNVSANKMDSKADANINAHSFNNCKSCETNQGTEPSASAEKIICNFPTPWELANLDERFLAKRCGLGYRAGRIIRLAQGIVEGKIPLKEFEQVRDGGCLSTYNNLTDQLTQIEGFGPFTRANVLMCMGFYHVIPTDSETVRHLKQVHAKNSTTKTVQMDVQEIYGNYAPFQFLAYWAELWHFYEQRFGKPSEMSSSDYKLITASNMKYKGHHGNKKTKIS